MAKPQDSEDFDWGPKGANLPTSIEGPEEEEEMELDRLEAEMDAQAAEDHALRTAKKIERQKGLVSAIAACLLLALAGWDQPDEGIRKGQMLVLIAGLACLAVAHLLGTLRRFPWTLFVCAGAYILLWFALWSVRLGSTPFVEAVTAPVGSILGVLCLLGAGAAIWQAVRPGFLARRAQGG